MQERQERKAVADHGHRALLAVRARFFVTYRFAVRVGQLALAEGAAKVGPWRLLLAVGVAVDIATWWALRKHDRLGLKARLAVDSADIAAWSLGPYTPSLRYDLAVFVGVPLAIDVGIRQPRLALVVPTVTFAVTTALRAAVGQPFAPLPFLWLFLAALCGVVLSRYDRRLRAETEHEWARRRSAEDARAYLAGQNAVAMGASSVVDRIEGVLPVLGPPVSGSALWRLADGWKTGLGSVTRKVWAYLGDALLEWQRDYNRHPDLHSQVVLDAEMGTGTTLLSNRQVLALRRQLDALPAPGTYTVCLADPSVAQRPPGGAVRLCARPHVIDIPADEQARFSAYDPGPLAFALFGLLSLGDVIALDVPGLAAAACLGLHFTATWWSHHRVRRLGSAARPAIMLLAVVVAVAVASVFTIAAQNSHNSTGPLYPVVSGLDLLAVIAGMYRATFRHHRYLLPIVFAGAVAVPVIAWSLHPGPRPLFNLVQGLLWPLCAFVTAWRYSRELETAVRRHAADAAVDDAVARAEAFESGRDTVLVLVRQAVSDAHHRLADLRPELEPRLYNHVKDTLKEADRRLHTLSHDAGSCSLTTTTSPSTGTPPD